MIHDRVEPLCPIDPPREGLGAPEGPPVRPGARSPLLLATALALAALASGCDNEVIVQQAPGACPAGQQDHDGDGTCLPTCATVGYGCSGHGHCVDASGLAQCVCDAGYYADGLDACVGSSSECATATPLSLVSQTVTGSTVGHGDDYAGSCAASSGEEVVYRLQALDDVEVTFLASGYDTLLHLRRACDDPTSEIACDDNGAGGNAAQIQTPLAAGSYFLFVDGPPGAGGNFTLSIDVRCPNEEVFDPVTGLCRPPAGPGENCDDPLVLPVGPEGSVAGSTVGATDDGQGSCAGAGPDQVYTFELAERMRVRLRMEGYDTVLHLRSACEAPQSEIACNDDSYDQSSRIVQILEPGRYYVFADSYSEPGDYELAYTFRPDPCAGDPCPGIPECVASQDWSSFECVCPIGTILYEGNCVDDPCDPNPCLAGAAHRTRCQADLADATAECLCAVGYVDDPGAPGGACLEDETVKDWAVFVYLNADNDLEPFGYDDLAEMEQVGSSADVDIVVLMDTDVGDGGDGRYLHVGQGTSTVVENLGEVDMGSWQTLREFGSWAVTAYPARHQALVLWDHGDGWKASGPTVAPYKAFSADYHGNMGGIHLSNGDYARALQGIATARGDKLDIVGFDACLMGMWEVAEATAPYALRLVASEETIPAEGWLYHAWLAPLVANPSWGPNELGVSMVDTYHDGSLYNSTLALSDLEQLPALRSALSNFADALVADPTLYSSVESARLASQTFYASDSYRDLRDLVTRVRNIAAASPELEAAADALLAALDLVVLHSRAQSGYPGAFGLSIYAPARQSGTDPDYWGAGAVWSQSTSWDEFLQSFAQ